MASMQTMTVRIDPLNDMTHVLPAWAWKFVCRLAKLEPGRMYTVTVLMTDGEPVWTVQDVGRVENQQ